jgi:hypothetical protein
MMKKIITGFLLIFLIFACLGCSGDIADTSENIESVDASYSIANTPGSTDKLRKSAELAYTKMAITPKQDVTVKGISFDAKLKSGNSRIFTIKVYVSRYNQETNSSDQIILIQEEEITVTDVYSTIRLNLNEPYGFLLSAEEGAKPNKKDALNIEFYESGELNSEILFSLNNIILLT